MKQKFFRSNYVVELINNVKRGKIDLYKGEKFPINEDMILVKNDVEEPENLEIIMPDKDAKDNKDFENAVSIYNAYPSLNRTQATDIRFWIYLSHTVYWSYLLKRWPLTGNQERDKNNILQHWFIDGLNAKNLARHGVSSLWWGVNTTVQSENEDPYKLTKEFFSLAEYKWEFTEGSLGRYPNLTRAFLEYVCEKKEVFEGDKQDKVRSLKKKLNFISGYTILGKLSKDEIKNRLSTL
jgi:hypothetical protein